VIGGQDRVRSVDRCSVGPGGPSARDRRAGVAGDTDGAAGGDGVGAVVAEASATRPVGNGVRVSRRRCTHRAVARTAVGGSQDGCNSVMASVGAGIGHWPWLVRTGRTSRSAVPNGPSGLGRRASPDGSALRADRHWCARRSRSIVKGGRIASGTVRTTRGQEAHSHGVQRGDRHPGQAEPLVP
jgi:hypothetical protein